MSTAYDLPTSLELARVEQVLLPKKVAASPFFRYFPFEGKRATVLRWTQRDNFTGLMDVRGIGGKPAKVALTGDKTYLADPGYYGNFVPLDERELTERRDAATLSGGPIGIADLVAQAQEELLDKRLARQEWMISKLMTTGTFSVSDASGTVVDTASYTQQSVSPSTPWSTHATSTPLADIRSAQLMPVGQSVNMGSNATLLMNRKWFNHMIANSNASDLGGKKSMYGATLNSEADINKILMGEGLPQVEVYEGGYYTTSNVWTRFIPDNVGVMIGSRVSGAPIGTFRYTLNVNSPGGAPSPYTRVIVKDQEVPLSVEVHDGFNGGLTLMFPGTIVLMNI